MRFLDYNGSNGLDPQDIATSVAAEETARKSEEADSSKHLGSNAGCATMAAIIALPILIVSLAL
ncbi:MAG: hypothetical protein IJI68_13790 [Eggerthellaceae bacterium]|nr:hypothetical protein [Eggerthellaceae bacterium]